MSAGGDGGSGGDPENNGQDPTTLLGSILRIDIDRADGDRAYGIRETLFHDPYYQRHVVGTPAVRSAEGGQFRCEANYAVFRTKLSDATTVFNVGRTIDVVVPDAGDAHAATEIAFHLGAPVRLVRASTAAVEEALRRLRSRSAAGGGSSTNGSWAATPAPAKRTCIAWPSSR